MIVFKITLDIEGENLFPDKLLSKLSEELILSESFSPNDTYIKKGKTEKYDFGGMYLMHPKKICFSGDQLENYENTIIQYLKKNYQILTENGGSEICISYEVYFSGDNFNIGLFNQNNLKIISNCNATISFSGYQMSEEKIILSFR